MSFPNGSSAGLDGILPQILNDLTAKSNGQTGLNFLRALTNLVNVILEGKLPFELRPYFFGAKLIALKSPMEDFVLSVYVIRFAGCPQNVPDTMSSNHIKQDMKIDSCEIVMLANANCGSNWRNQT